MVWEKTIPALGRIVVILGSRGCYFTSAIRCCFSGVAIIVEREDGESLEYARFTQS